MLYHGPSTLPPPTPFPSHWSPNMQASSNLSVFSSPLHLQTYVNTNQPLCPYLWDIFSRFLLIELSSISSLETGVDRPGDGVRMSKRYNCRYCINKEFKSSWHLERHELIHTGLKPFRCKICGRMFNQVYSLKRHCKVVHRQSTVNLCAKYATTSRWLSLCTIYTTTTLSLMGSMSERNESWNSGKILLHLTWTDIKRYL